MKQHLPTLLLCATLLLPAALHAQTGNWSDHRDTTWSVTATPGATNYIATAAQLAQFASLVTYANSLAGTTTLITNSLDLSPHQWNPAGPDTPGFQGTLIALPGVLLHGLTITTTDFTLEPAALFETINENGLVHGLTLTNTCFHFQYDPPSPGSIYLIPFIGSIAVLNRGTILNCTNHGLLSGWNHAFGGIAANNFGTIANCANHAPIHGSENGGIAAYNTGTITNCANHAPVQGDLAAGGIACDNTGIITHCTNHGFIQGDYTAGGITDGNRGTLRDSTNHGTIQGYYEAGGIASGNSGTTANSINHGPVTSSSDAGGIASYNSGTILNCANHGQTISLGDRAGGIASYQNGDTPAILNSINYAPVTASGNHAGGISGYFNYYGRATIANCVNHGPVTSPGQYTGAIAGRHSSLSGLFNCYWNPATSGQTTATGLGSPVNCAPFTTVPGLFTAPVTILPADTATSRLLTALNAWVITPRIAPPAGIPYQLWTLHDSPNGFPRLTPAPAHLTPLPPATHTTNLHASLPPILLPNGGFHDPATHRVHDLEHDLICYPGQPPLTISHIAFNTPHLHLTFPAPAILLGKANLTDPHWTYINKSPGVTPSPTSATILPTASPFRFFTAADQP